MASLAKTVVATGLSSGLGFEALKQLLEQGTPYKIIMGARDTKTTNEAIEKLKFDRAASALTVLPLELSDLKTVKAFAQQALDKIGNDRVDYVLLNAGLIKDAKEKGPNGMKWCEAAVVNHLSQHYLLHSLREKLAASKTRVVFVSSGAIRNVPDPSTLETTLTGASGADGRAVYAGSKFIQFLGAQWWRRELHGQCDVVAVSPGLIPNTGLARHSEMKLTMDMPDAKSVPEGAASILAALKRDDIPEDPERMMLTSWGEWWGKNVYEKALDKSLQERWCPSEQELEKEAGITA